MQAIAFVTVLFACFVNSEGSHSVEKNRYPHQSLGGLLLAMAPGNVLRAQPSLSRHTSPEMIKASRRALAAPKPRSKRLDAYTAALEILRREVETADVIFSVKSEGLTVAQRDALKNDLPEGALACTVKNTLMKMALADCEELKPAEEFCTGCNMWFFVKFEDLRETIKAVETWQKESGVEIDEYQVRGGAMDGSLLDAKGVKAASKLPTKQELMGQVAFMVKQIPTKLARGVNMVPKKLAYGVKALDAENLARAVKAMGEKIED